MTFVALQHFILNLQTDDIVYCGNEYRVYIQFEDLQIVIKNYKQIRCSFQTSLLFFLSLIVFIMHHCDVFWPVFKKQLRWCYCNFIICLHGYTNSKVLSEVRLIKCFHSQEKLRRVDQHGLLSGLHLFFDYWQPLPFQCAWLELSLALLVDNQTYTPTFRHTRISHFLLLV